MRIFTWVAVWRWWIICPDCGLRRCSVMRYRDLEMDHRGWYGK